MSIASIGKAVRLSSEAVSDYMELREILLSTKWSYLFEDVLSKDACDCHEHSEMRVADYEEFAALQGLPGR